MTEQRLKRAPSGVADNAIEKIKAMVLSGALQPGDRLPREEDLASLLGLSRSSLREAISALELMRVLDVRRGDGTYVTSLAPELLLEAVSFVIDFHRDDSVLHFMEIRRLLEPAAIALVARSITGDQIAQLRAILDASSPDASPDEFVLNDQAFHRKMVSFCGKPVLASLLETIAGPTHRSRVWRGLSQPGAYQRTLGEHRAIVDALERHEPDLASARTVVHIAGVEDWLRRLP